MPACALPALIAASPICSIHSATAGAVTAISRQQSHACPHVPLSALVAVSRQTSVVTITPINSAQLTVISRQRSSACSHTALPALVAAVAPLSYLVPAQVAVIAGSGPMRARMRTACAVAVSLECEIHTAGVYAADGD